MKRIIALIVLSVMLLGLMPMATFAEGQKIAADLCKSSVINNVGLPASALYTKSGEYSMKYSGDSLNKAVKIPTVRDWSEQNTLEMWVYSPNSIKTPVCIALISDNKETNGLDYYMAEFYTGKVGWSLISLPYSGENSVFEAVNNPKGFNDIDRIELWGNYGENIPAKGTEIYLDKMMLVTKTEEEISEIEQAEQMSGAQSEEVIVVKNKQISTQNADWPVEVSDWTGYNTLGFRIHSEKATGRALQIVVKQETEATAGPDYFYAYITLTWEGWKDIEFDMRDGGAWQGANQPQGWDKVTGISIWNDLSAEQKASGKFDNDTSIATFEKIYLTNRDWENKVNGPNVGNYTIETVSEDWFIDYNKLIAERYSGEKAHPRLLFNSEKLENMKKWIKTDKYMMNSYASLKQLIKENMQKGPVSRPSSVEPFYATQAALMYNLTGEQVYADYVWASMENLCLKFVNWNQSKTPSYLSVGDTMRAVAFVYDWMYNYWTEEQRQLVRNTMMHFGVEITMSYLRPNRNFCGGQGGNWNHIVMGGVSLVALAISGDGEEYNDVVNEVLNRSVKGFKNIHSLTVDEAGSFLEGPSYWQYGMGNFLTFLSAMYDVTGTTSGLMELPGMRNTGNYAMGMSGPKGFYNFADGGGATSYISAAGYFFLSRYYNDPCYGAYQVNYTIENGGDYYSLLLYEPKEEYLNFLDYMPEYAYFPGMNEVVTIRHSWIDDNAAFLGLKAGSNKVGHGNLDIGSFVFDMLGVRWAHELGRDSYDYDHMPFGRYTFYRNRAEGQNALVINPDGGVDQNTQAHCYIDELEVKDNAAYVTMDITEAYEGKGVDSVKRGFALLNNYGSLLIRDEIQSSDAIEVYSFIHTKAEIDVASDGKSAVLTQDGQKLRAKLVGNSKGVLLDMPADPLPDSPNPSEMWSRGGYRKLAVYVDGEISPEINLLLTPYVEEKEYEFNLNNVLSLSKWKKYVKDMVEVENIYLDGIPISNFSSTTSSYIVNEWETGEITCDAPEGVKVSVKQAEKLGDSAFILAESTSSDNKAVYVISFANQVQEVMESSTYTPKKLDATLSPENVIRMFDASTTTDWSVEGPASAVIDFGREREMREVKIIWYKGGERIAYFTLYASNDGVNWREIYNGESYQTPDRETYTFEPVKARYLKIYGAGNTSNNWVSICDFRVTAFEDSFEDISGHWAKEDIQNLANVGIVSGTGNGLFNPDGDITRAEFVKLIQKVLGFADAENAVTFNDVSDESWYAGGIENAYNLGIIPEAMIKDGNFLPNQPITFEEMLAIATEAINKDTDTKEQYISLEGYKYADSVSEWCVGYIQNAKALKLLSGSLLENESAPTENATRAQAAVIAKRVYIKTF